MSRAEVRRVVGELSAVRATLQNKLGQTIEVWEYLYDRGAAPDATYWLNFYEGKLAE